MDFLENVKNVVESAAQTVVKKSGEVAQYSKIKYSMYDTSNSIKNLYSQIGEEVYKSYKDNTPLSEDIKDMCGEIDKLNEHLDAFSEQLSGIKASIKCGSCGKNVKSECSYCPYCGEKLAADVVPDFDEGFEVTNQDETEAGSDETVGE